MKSQKFKSKLSIHPLLIIGACIIVLPFLWMIITSEKTLAESVKIPPSIFPENFQWINFNVVLDKLLFIQFYINTGLMIIFRVVGSVLFSEW